MEEVWLWGAFLWVSDTGWIKGVIIPVPFLCHSSATADAARSHDSVQARAFQRQKQWNVETDPSFLLLTQTCWKKCICFPIPLLPMTAHDVRFLYLLFNPWHTCFLKTRDNNSSIREFKDNAHGVRQSKSNTYLTVVWNELGAAGSGFNFWCGKQWDSQCFTTLLRPNKTHSQDTPSFLQLLLPGSSHSHGKGDCHKGVRRTLEMLLSA